MTIPRADEEPSSLARTFRGLAQSSNPQEGSKKRLLHSSDFLKESPEEAIPSMDNAVPCAGHDYGVSFGLSPYTCSCGPPFAYDSPIPEGWRRLRTWVHRSRLDSNSPPGSRLSKPTRREQNSYTWKWESNSRMSWRYFRVYTVQV